MQPEDRRRYRRFTLQVEATVLLGPAKQPARGHLLELSSGGAFVTAPAAIEVGSAAFIHFLYDDHVCEATGHVVRVLPFGTASGVAIEYGFANPELDALLRALADIPDALRPELLGAIRDVEIRLA